MFKYFVVLLFCISIISCQQEKQIQTTVELIDSTVFQKILDENHDNILVVNVWATWCVPCVKEMPDLNRLANEYKDKKVKIISISIDYADEIESKIIPFIQKHKINFPVYVNNFENDEKFINYLNLEWSGAIPATFIYDKKGNQKKFLSGKHSFTDFKEAVELVL